METKRSYAEIQILRNMMGVSNVLVMDCRGKDNKRNEGLALLWNDEVDLTIMIWLSNHIWAMIN